MGMSGGTPAPEGGKKPVDADLNLVPFIDLLVCCICFLLITAVWSQMASIKSSQQAPGSGGHTVPKIAPRRVTVLVGSDGYTLTAGALRKVLPRSGRHYDTAALQRQLRRLRSEPSVGSRVTVAVEDGVPYSQLIEAMDVARRAQFSQIHVRDAALHL